MTPEEKAREAADCPCSDDIIPEDYREWSYISLVDHVRQVMEDFYLAGYSAAQPQWISVEDRLPERDYYVLVHIADGSDGHQGCYRSSVVDCWRGEFWCRCTGTITHWMPLPELPKEGE